MKPPEAPQLISRPPMTARELSRWDLDDAPTLVPVPKPGRITPSDEAEWFPEGSRSRKLEEGESDG